VICCIAPGRVFFQPADLFFVAPQRFADVCLDLAAIFRNLSACLAAALGFAFAQFLLFFFELEELRRLLVYRKNLFQYGENTIV